MIKDLIERYNLDSEGKPKCSGRHEMKRFDAPWANGRGKDGLGCDICNKGIECKDGYYNCE